MKLNKELNILIVGLGLIFMKELQRMRNYIVTDDLEGMKEMMICSTERRKTFDKA